MPGTPGFPLPSYMGSTITLLCRFWLLGREIAMIYEGDQPSINARVPLSVMELKYQQYLAFGDELPSSTDAPLPHHSAVLQSVLWIRSHEMGNGAKCLVRIWYHTAIISLMQPWAGKQIVLRTFASTDSTPEGVIDASLRQLKRLMISFRLSYAHASFNIHWHLCLIYIANSALADSETDPEWRFYFMACLSGYNALYPAYPVAELCFKGLLTMAMEKNKIGPAEARRLLKELLRRGEHHRMTDVYSGMRLDLDATNLKGSAKAVEDLAARFEASALHDADDGATSNLSADNDDALFNEMINLDEVGYEACG